METETETKRKTVQRGLISGAVKSLDTHVTADRVFEHIVKEHPSISKATVYRNLNQMAKSGELLNIGAIYGSTHYDCNCHPHCHFICKDCRRVFDVFDVFETNGEQSDGIGIGSGIDIGGISGRIEETSGFSVTACQIFFSGLCRECKSKNRDGK